MSNGNNPIFNSRRKDSIPGKTAIRFCRWSRKPYAVFAGIHRNISIGQLNKGVIDRLFLKTNTLEIIVPHGSHLSLQIKSMDEILAQNILPETCPLSIA